MVIRDTLQEKPWIGWSVVAALLVFGAYLVVRNFVGAETPELLAQDIVIRYEDTGDEESVNRGHFEVLLVRLANRNELKLDEGMTNPKTGKKTGYPIDREYWERIVSSILEARRQYDLERQSTAPPSGGRRR